MSHFLSVLTLTVQKKHFAIELNKTSTSIIEVLTHPIGSLSKKQKLNRNKYQNIILILHLFVFLAENNCKIKYLHIENQLKIQGSGKKDGVLEFCEVSLFVVHKSFSGYQKKKEKKSDSYR